MGYPDRVPHAHVPLVGFCAEVSGVRDGGNCTAGGSGTWADIDSLASCAATCRGCERCNFVSYSRASRNCFLSANDMLRPPSEAIESMLCCDVSIVVDGNGGPHSRRCAVDAPSKPLPARLRWP